MSFKNPHKLKSDKKPFQKVAVKVKTATVKTKAKKPK